MATSGTTAFDLDFTELAEEAWARAGREMNTGYQLRTARRCMNLLLIEWQNRGRNLWSIDSGTIAMVANTAEYNLPADTVDLTDQVIRTDAGSASLQSDLSITRIDLDTYAAIPNKLSTGRPIQVYINRQRAQPTITVWPVPDQSSKYTFVYWRMRRLEDAGFGVENPDVVFRFYPALVDGLAYQIAKRTPGLEMRVDMLQQAYAEQYRLASEEDRDKTPLRLVPRSFGPM